MSEAIRGSTGTGTVLAYEVPRGYRLALEMLYFKVVCGAAAGIHKARVTFLDKALDTTTARMRDLNEGGANETLYYTYGLGLNASACVTVDGWEMTDALPYTELSPDTEIHVAMIDDNGNVIAGDTIDPVTLVGTLVNAGTGSEVTLLPGLLPA